MLCQQNQDINKDQLLGRKAFLYNKDITQLKAGKENIYKIQGGFFVVFIMLKGLFRIFNLINRKALMQRDMVALCFFKETMTIL